MTTRHYHGVGTTTLRLDASMTAQGIQDEIASAVRLAYALAEDDLRHCFGNHGDFDDGEKQFSHSLLPLTPDERGTPILLTATCTTWIRYR